MKEQKWKLLQEIHIIAVYSIFKSDTVNIISKIKEQKGTF
jgi:hypothetical protein